MNLKDICLNLVNGKQVSIDDVMFLGEKVSEFKKETFNPEIIIQMQQHGMIMEVVNSYLKTIFDNANDFNLSIMTLSSKEGRLIKYYINEISKHTNTDNSQPEEHNTI